MKEKEKKKFFLVKSTVANLNMPAYLKEVFFIAKTKRFGPGHKLKSNAPFPSESLSSSDFPLFFIPHVQKIIQHIKQKRI